MLSAPWRNLRQRGAVIRALALFLLISIVYIANSRHLEWGDTIPTRYLPLSIIREFDFDLDEFPFLYTQVIPYYLQNRNGHFVSSYPVGAALLAVPFYLIPVLSGISAQSPWLPFLEKLSAAAIAVLSAFFLYLALRRLASERTSMIVTAVYALGTSTFSISGQALWQHGPSQFFLTLGLYLLLRGVQEEGFIPWSGFPLSAAVVCRQTDVLLVLPLFIYIAHYHRGRLLQWVSLALPPAIFLMSYNYVYFGSAFEMGYGGGVLNPTSSDWSTPFFDGFLGLLVSPSKGLFVYSPILLLACFGIYCVWKGRKEPLLRYLSLGPILVLLLYSKWHFWWGSETYGPRLVADITPVLSLYLYPVWDTAEGRKARKSLFVVLAVTSLLMHAIGAYSFDTSWYQKGAVDVNADRLWSWRDSPFVHYGTKLFLRNLSFVRTWVSGLPTSAQAPHELAAAMVLPDVPESLSASKPMALTIAATNTGRAIWLFQTNFGPGAASLGWRWWQDDRPVPFGEGRAGLSRDIFPGGEERLRLEIWPPSAPGDYTLQLGMVRDPDMWFAQQWIPFQVDGSCNFQGVMDKTPPLQPDPSHIYVSTDKPAYRPGEVSTFTFSIVNGGIPRNLMFYVVLGKPDGRLLFLSTPRVDAPPNPPCNVWAHVGHLHLHSKHFRVHWQVGLPLQDMPPGLYTLYIFSTKPNTTEVVAKATATFLLLPQALVGLEDNALQ